MNREILFRGKRIDNGEWVYGYYVYIPAGRHGEHEYIIQTVEDSGKIGLLYDVIPETVGQYTGLTDKNGKKVFEGDVLNGGSDEYTGYYGQPVVHIGEFFDGNVSYDLEYESEGYGGYGIYISTKKGQACIAQEHAESFEIIGNIHDNPELIGGVGDG